MRKVSRVSANDIVLFLVIWVYYSLNAKYINFSAFTLLRWIFPFVLIGMAVLQNRGRVIAPPAIFGWLAVAILPSILFGADVFSSTAKFLSLALIFYGSYIFFYQLKSAERMHRCLCILVVVLVIFQVLNFVFTVLGIGLVGGRYTGITTNANTLGVYSNLAFWAGVFLLKSVGKKNQKGLGVLFLSTTVYTVVASGSRTAFLVMVLNILLVGFLGNKKRKSFVVLLLGVLLAGYLILSGKLNFLNITAINRLSEEGGTSREDLWELAIAVWKDHPLLGVGYTLSARFNLIEYGLAFHNSYLSFLVECGIWGAVVLGTAITSLVVKIVNEVRKISITKQWGELGIACMMLVNLAIAGWSESFLFAVGSTEGFTFWFLLAWVIVYIMQMDIERKPDMAGFWTSEDNFRKG